MSTRPPAGSTVPAHAGDECDESTSAFRIERHYEPIDPRSQWREFLVGFDAAGGGWRNRIQALLILWVLVVAVTNEPLSRWILGATILVILLLAAAGWIFARMQGETHEPLDDELDDRSHDGRPAA